MSGSDRTRGEFGTVVGAALGGFALGALLGGIVAAAVQNDPGGSLDRSAIAIGLGVGAVIGAVAGIVVGVIRDRRHANGTATATATATVSDQPNAVEPEDRSQDLVRGTPHASDPRPLTGHGSVVP